MKPTMWEERTHEALDLLEGLEHDWDSLSNEEKYGTVLQAIDKLT